MYTTLLNLGGTHKLDIIEILKVVFLGIVEGITEWLPISSTGHMLLVDEFIKLNMSDSFKEMFFVVIQLGAIGAVVMIYFNKLYPFGKDKTVEEKKGIWTLWFKVVVACIPSILIGLPFDDIIEEHLYSPIVIALALIIYGIIFIVVENRNKEATILTMSDLTYKTALYIGLFQVLALIPGTSRSGATIIGAMLVSTSRAIAAEFTFYLSIPTMFGASLLKILKFGLVFTTYEAFILLLGMFVAFVVSIFTIKFLIGYIKKNDFKVFGIYRIILGVIVLAYFSFV